MTSARLKPLLSGASIVLLALLVWWTTTGSPTPEPEATSAEPAAAAPAVEEESAAQDATPFSDLPTVGRAELPPEAIATLADIAAGGPYEFSRDDSVFQNREGFLPDRAQGHYREYTVITPGSDDRGARRIVAGADGELFYTEDHYASFREILL